MGLQFTTKLNTSSLVNLRIILKLQFHGTDGFLHLQSLSLKSLA